MFLKKKVVAIAATLGAAAMVLGACASPASAPPAGSAEPQGTLRLSNYVEAANLDPQLTVVQAGVAIFPEYDTLLSYDADGKLVPWLATKWEQTEPLTWRFELRDDVDFHDGTHFDATAVKVNLERAKELVASPYAYFYSLIDTVDVVEDYVVEVNFSTPWPNFDYDMANVAGGMISPKAIEDGQDLARNPAGSGGWIWSADDYVDGSKHVYDLNEDYWNKEAQRVETVEVHIIADANARFNGLESGQLDVGARLNALHWDPAEAAGITLNGGFIETGSLMILDREGTIAPALADVRVREAMRLLLDREAWNKSRLAGHGDPSIAGFAAPGSWWYDESLDEDFPPQANVKKAKALLADAGYPDGFSYPQGTSAPTLPSDEAIAQMLAAGGIKVELTEIIGGQYAAEYRKGIYAAGISSPVSGNPWEWFSRQVASTGAYNPFNVQDTADLEELYAEALNTTDQDVQAEIFAEIQREVIERGILISTSAGQLKAGIATNVGGLDNIVQGPRDMAPRPYYLTVE
jgi:peptide/nickel transport system substrate-binding protein